MKNTLLTFYLLFILITEILIKLEFYTFAFVFIILWTLVYTVAIIKAVKMMSPTISSESSVLEKIISRYNILRKILNILLAIPVMILIVLSFPFKDNHLYNLIITYSIFGVMTGVYLINYKTHIREVGHNLKNLRYLIPGLMAIIPIAYINYKFLQNNFFENNIYSYFILVFASYISVLYFRGLLQNLFHKITNPTFTIIYISILITILSIQTNSILEIATTFLSSLIIGIIFYSSKNIYVVFLLQITLNLLQYLVLPNNSILPL